MPKLGIYLAYNNAKEAMEYYEKNFKAEILTREVVTPEMNETFQLDPTTLENSTFSGEFSIQGVRFNCSDKVDHNGPLNDSFNPLIDYTKEESDNFDELISIIRKSDAKIIYEELEGTEGFKMFRFIDPFNITWSLILAL